MITEVGAKLIKLCEGFRPSVYSDAVGIATVGYGHVVRPDDSLELPLTEEAATSLMMDDLAKIEPAILRLVLHAPIEWELDALLSFCFNLGTNALRSSTLLRLYNTNAPRGAAHEFLRWTHAGGKELPGLVRRRHAESALFLGAHPETVYRLATGR